MDTALLKQYEKINAKYRALEEERDGLKATIVASLKKEGIEKTQTDYGTFTVAAKVSYEYSAKVKALEERTKLAKVKEEQKGIATVKKTTEYLVFTENKD